MTSLRDLKYRTVYDGGIIVSRNKENTIGLFNSIDDVNRVFKIDILNDSLNRGMPYNIQQAYPELNGFEISAFIIWESNWYKTIRWSENGLCFITLADGRVLVGAPRVLMKKEDGEK